MKTTFSRVLAGMLCVALVVGMVPFTVSAADYTGSQLAVITDKESTLAPGVTLNSVTAYDKNGDQVKMFVTTADMSVDTVKLFASYKDMNPTDYGMSKLTEQVEAFDQKAAAGDAYYQGTVVAGINASYYNMTTGKPTGTFVMNGIDVTNESEGNAYGYFAVMKDGSVKIGDKNDYSKDKGNIQEAIGIHTMLIINNQMVASLDDVTKYPRQTIGITADNKVILMTADGNQAPRSIGLTLREQAQVMADLGCVWAGHLDGGGSATYGCKAEGANEFAVTNSPADGSARSISNGFIVVSTAAASDEFDRAVITPEYEYVTPGSTVAFTVKGVSAAGTAAEIPENAVFSATNGSVVDGAFVSDGTVGDATVTMLVDGVAVGKATIHVVLPQAIAFKQAEMVVPYGKTVGLDVTATYGVNEVKLQKTDISFALSEQEIGTIQGWSFVAAEEGVAVTTAVVTVTVNGTDVSATANLSLGKGSEVLEDFESGTLGTWTAAPWSSSAGVTTNLEIVTSETGKVHSGKYSMALDMDFSQRIGTGYMMAAVYFPEDIHIENALRVGMWVYLPEEFVGLYARYCAYNGPYDPMNAKTNRVGGGTFDETVADEMDTGYVFTIEESGWRYFSIDVSAYPDIYFWKEARCMEFYTSDRDGTAFGYQYLEKGSTGQVNTSTYGKYTLYFDDLMVDYSAAVDDREAPVFGNVSVIGEGESVITLDRLTQACADHVIPEFTTNTLTIGAAVAENMTFSNATGLNEKSAKCYVDGYEVACKYVNGSILLDNATFTNGIHTIRFVIEDNFGNASSVVRKINVKGAATNPTMQLVPADPNADRIYTGSLYYVNLETADLANVAEVTVEMDLNSVSKWELKGMEVAEGFTASYEFFGSEDGVKITFRRVSNIVTDTTVLASIPVRAWYHNPGIDPVAKWKGQSICPVDVRVEIDSGKMTMKDGQEITFTSDRIRVDTEIYGNYAVLNKNGDYAKKTSWHIHTVTELADAAATCTKNGYTDRTYCEVCASVLDWGMIEPATGHTYEMSEGVLQCACGGLFNGIYTDGKTYVDGVVVADGWSGESYYADGVKLTGLQKIDGYYYFFDENGICADKARADGFCYNEAADAYMYLITGTPVTGDMAISLVAHSFDKNGYAYHGERTVLGYVCTFEKGAFVSAEDADVLEAGCVGTNLEYVLLADGTLLIEGEGDMRDYSVSGSYGPWFYANMENVKYVRFGSKITGIGEYAFNRCEYVRTVSFEAGSELTVIEPYAFRACHRLDCVNLPASLEKISNYAFFKCGGLTTVNFEENSNLNYIGREAFAESHYLKKIAIPASVMTLGENLFKRSKAAVVMQVVKESAAYFYAIENGIAYELVEGEVPSVASGACTDTISWALFPNGALIISGSGDIPNYASQAGQPWANVRHLVKKIVIGKDITAIGNYAFAYCEDTETIEFEEGSQLESIGVLAFRSARKVTEVILPESVATLQTYAFGTCTGLVNVYIPQGMGYMHPKAFVESANVVLDVAEGTYAEKYAVENAIAHKTRAFVYNAIAEGTCGDNATWAFYENGELIISGSGEIPNYASQKEQPWAGIRHLVKKIIIGKDITAIGNYAFAYCEDTEAIVFEEGSKLERIGVLSFRTARKVTEVILPETVTYLNAYAFGTCPSLVNVYIPQGMGYMHPKAFIESANVVLNVAEGTYAEKYAADNGVAYETRDFVYIAVAEGTCGDNATWAFYENGELIISGSGAISNYASQKEQPWANIRHLVKKIVIGKDITAIGNYAFAYCEDTEAIVFEEGSKLERIGVLSFRTARKVTEVILPETVTFLNAYAFGTCPSLVNVYIPQGVSYLHTLAFVESANVVLNVAEGSYSEKYAIDNGIAYETRDFVYTAVAEGTCGENATWAFYENGELIISGSGAITNYASHKDQPWANIRHLVKKIVIGKDITAIGNYAFAYCENTEAVVFEEGSQLKSIGVLSFRTLRKVTEVILPETVTSLNAYAFGTCVNLVNVYIPQGVTYLNPKAFVESANVVLNVAAGSYAEQFAISNGVAYETR